MRSALPPVYAYTVTGPAFSPVAAAVVDEVSASAVTPAAQGLLPGVQSDISSSSASQKMGPAILDPIAVLRAKGLDKKIRAGDIHFMQSGLRRDRAGMRELHDDLLKNGHFRDPIDLVYFPEEGTVYVRNGHHRLAVMLEQGWEFLENADYRIEVSSRAEYMSVGFVLNADGTLDPIQSYVTPFDPATHVRQPFFFAYKNFIKFLFDNGVAPNELTRFIHETSDLYLVPKPKEPYVLVSEEAEEPNRDWQSYLATMDASMVEKIAQIITLLPNHGVVMEVGAGSGKMSFALAKMNPDLFVAGLDMSEAAVKHARTNFIAKNLIYLLGSACQKFAPSNSLNGVMDSSVGHEIISYNDFDFSKIIAYLVQVFDALLPGGSYGTRDFTSPHWPEKVRIRVPTAAENHPGKYGKLSRAALFRVHAEVFRSRKYPSGVPYVEIPSEDPSWAIFELDGAAAANFILRMEYRASFEAENKEEYTYATLTERVAWMEKLGFRVDFAEEVLSVWIYLNWWKSRLVVTDTSGNPIDLPPTMCLLSAVKPGPEDPLKLRIDAVTKLASTENQALVTYRDPSGCKWDVLHVAGATAYVVPFEVGEDGRVFMYVQQRVEELALQYYANTTEIFHGHLSGFTSEGYGLTLTPENAGLAAEEQFHLAVGGSAGVARTDLVGAISALAQGSAYFPVPGLSDEIIHPVYVELKSDNALDHGTRATVRVELKQLLASCHLGAIPDGRLEAAAFILAEQKGAVLLPWAHGELPMTPQNISGLARKESYSDLVAPGTGAVFERSTEPAGFGEVVRLAATRLWLDGREEAIVKEYQAPKNYSLDTFVGLVYVKSPEGRVYVGLETRDLPALQMRDLDSRVSVVPAWRLPHGIASGGAATKYLKDRLRQDFDLLSRHVTPLGAGYFPSAAQTPEKITPFAIELDAASCPRDLVFLPLGKLVEEISKIPDLHTRIAVLRLAMALGIVKTGGASICQ